MEEEIKKLGIRDNIKYKSEIQKEYPASKDNTKLNLYWWDLLRLKIKKGWGWLNGKKSKFGALMSLVTGIMLVSGVSGPALMICGSLAVLLDGVGVAHWGLKEQTKFGAKGEFGSKETHDLVVALWELIKEILRRFKALK